MAPPTWCIERNGWTWVPVPLEYSPWRPGVGQAPTRSFIKETIHHCFSTCKFLLCLLLKFHYHKMMPVGQINTFFVKESCFMRVKNCQRQVVLNDYRELGFLPSYDLAPPPPIPPLPSVSSIGDTEEDLERVTTCWKDRGEGVGEEPKYTKARINHSIHSGQRYSCLLLG